MMCVRAGYHVSSGDVDTRDCNFHGFRKVVEYRLGSCVGDGGSKIAILLLYCSKINLALEHVPALKILQLYGSETKLDCSPRDTALEILLYRSSVRCGVKRQQLQFRRYNSCYF